MLLLPEDATGLSRDGSRLRLQSRGIFLLLRQDHLSSKYEEPPERIRRPFIFPLRDRSVNQQCVILSRLDGHWPEVEFITAEENFNLRSASELTLDQSL